MRLALPHSSAFALLLLLLCCAVGGALAQQPTGAPSPNGGSTSAPSTGTPNAASPRVYTLPPQREAEAIAYARAGHILYFVNFAWTIAVLLLFLRFRVAARFRDWAERATLRRFLQLLIFAPALVITLDLLLLPGGAAAHWLERRFGQSIQGWGSWLWDQSKGGVLGIVVVVFFTWMLYALIRRSPRRWWLYVWLLSLPLIAFFTFISPVLIEPLFFRYTPLADSHPQLAAQLERVVRRGGENIPESRMFLMHASSKLTVLNAYVTGLGGSSRVVVWDTTIDRMTTPEIMFVFGHEMGHYVLGHVFQGLVFAAVLLFFALWLGSGFYRWAVRRYGGAGGMRGIDDWAGLPALLLFFLLFDFALTPVSNAFSRHIEHQADQYGLEVVHGVITDVPAVAAQSFQILGDVDLAEPNPSRFVEFWFYTHPSINERIVFAREYDPWGRGESPRFVK